MPRPVLRRRWTLLVLPVLLLAGPAAGQMEALRANNDQFIQGLREEGMAELLERFVEQVDEEGGLDPIAQRQLEIAQKEFASSAALQRAIELQEVDDVRAQSLFEESRSAYESMLESQRAMIDENPDDERVPIWATDLSAMLLESYLPTYYNNASWYYEFGVPTAEQREAFERSAVLALELTSDARHRLEMLTGRLAQDTELRGRLEGLGIYYLLRDDYAQRRVPFWYGHAAYYTALLPQGHAYYQTLGSNDRVRNQENGAAAERLRLLDQAEAAVGGSLLNDAEVGAASRLLAGRVLVATGDEDRVDEGVDDFLEPVITTQADNWMGYLASLAKAKGREAVGELDTATEILEGMAKHTFVTRQLNAGNIAPRLIAADLLHRMYREPAELARGADRAALMAEAYDKPYLPLVSGDLAAVFSPTLFHRWAAEVDGQDDPMSFPPMVRMGIGQIRTQQGAGPATEVIFASQNSPLGNIAIPADRQRESDRRAALAAEARAHFEQALAYNESLADPEIEDAVRAAGLMNLGFDRYYLAEIDKHVFGAGDEAAYLSAAEAWATLGQELPDAEQAEQAMSFALQLYQNADANHNIGEGGVARPDVRDRLRAAAGQMYEYWPNNDTAHAFRVYTGYYVYELSGQLEEAVDVYRGMPSNHPSYFEARRQMVLAMQKVYDNAADARRELALVGAPEEDAEAQAELSRDLAQRDEDLGRMRRELLDTAENLLIDADDELQNGSDVNRRFSAATAKGGALVAIASMESDGGDADAALEMLDGFELDFNPEGPLAPLVNAQPSFDAAKAMLDGLIQSAQERRILALVKADALDRIGDEARAMIDAYPDAASGVVDGVLERIEDQIDGYRDARDNALLQVNRDEAQRNITRLAGVAVQLSDLLVGWAKGRGLEGPRLLPFELGLAQALLLADRPDDAVPLLENWLENRPNDFNLLMLAAEAKIAAARARGDRSPAALKEGLDHYFKIILFYNAQPGEKPARFWEAWLEVLRTYDFIGGEQAAEIVPKIRMLQNRIDEGLGGPDFQRHFMDLFGKHLGNNAN